MFCLESGYVEELQIPRSPTPASKSGWLEAPVAQDAKFFSDASNRG